MCISKFSSNSAPGRPEKDVPPNKTRATSTWSRGTKTGSNEKLNDLRRHGRGQAQGEVGNNMPTALSQKLACLIPGVQSIMWGRNDSTTRGNLDVSAREYNTLH